jgi:hypothetical protein
MNQYGDNSAYHQEMNKNPENLFTVVPRTQMIGDGETRNNKIEGDDGGGCCRNQNGNHPKVFSLKFRHKEGLIQTKKDKDVSCESQAIDGIGFCINSKREAAINPGVKFAHHLKRTQELNKKLLNKE